jgi:hypothetical protein
MIITVINVSDPVQQAGKTPYNTISVTHETDMGKLEQKKLVSFNFPDVYNFFKSQQRGAKVEITRVKNEKGFWDWTSAREAGATTVSTEGAGSSKPAAGSSTRPVSNYETREERAWRQILIVRQSSASVATTALSAGAKAPVAVDAILTAAEQIENWVNRKPAMKLEDLPDDIPE